jgi:hypothetical protein
MIEESINQIKADATVSSTLSFDATAAHVFPCIPIM